MSRYGLGPGGQATHRVARESDFDLSGSGNTPSQMEFSIHAACCLLARISSHLQYAKNQATESSSCVYQGDGRPVTETGTGERGNGVRVSFPTLHSDHLTGSSSGAPARERMLTTMSAMIPTIKSISLRKGFCESGIVCVHGPCEFVKGALWCVEAWCQILTRSISHRGLFRSNPYLSAEDVAARRRRPRRL